MVDNRYDSLCSPLSVVVVAVSACAAPGRKELLAVATLLASGLSSVHPVRRWRRIHNVRSGLSDAGPRNGGRLNHVRCGRRTAVRAEAAVDDNAAADRHVLLSLSFSCDTHRN